MSQNSALQFLKNVAPVKVKFFQEICISTYGEDYSPLFEILLDSEEDLLPPAKLKWLLKQIDCNKPLNEKLQYPLHIASGKNVNSELFKKIIKLTDNIECRDDAGQTPLVYAATHEKYENFLTLFQQGANPNARDNYGIALIDILQYSINPAHQMMHNLLKIQTEALSLKTEFKNKNDFNQKNI